MRSNDNCHMKYINEKSCLDFGKLFGSESNAWPVKMFLLAQTSIEMSLLTLRESKNTPWPGQLLEIPVLVNYYKDCFNL